MPDAVVQIKAVLFDFDGTLTEPGAIDFIRVKAALNCPVDQPILEFIRAMQGAGERREAMERLNRFEEEAAAQSQPNAGAQEIVLWLKRRAIQLGILTRNSRNSVKSTLENFERIEVDDFKVIITRDDPFPPKPSGEGVLHAATCLGVKPRELLLVGDYIFDPQAGKAAGARTALLDPQDDIRLQEVDCDYRIRYLCELKTIVQNDFGLDDSLV